MATACCRLTPLTLKARIMNSRNKRLHHLAMAATLALVAQASQAAYVAKIEPNDTLSTPQNLAGHFSLDFDANIGNASSTNTSTLIPHASVIATGNSTFDYYTFTTVSAGDIILDIDSSRNLDAYLVAWGAGSPTSVLTQNDDAYLVAEGSTTMLDSFIQLNNKPAGQYWVGVGRCCSSAGAAGLASGTVVPSNANYTLHVSAMAAVPEPQGLSLVLGGLVAAAPLIRRKMNA
jgi:hypothetical protein